MSDDYSMVQVSDVAPEPSKSSGTLHVDLVEELGCEKMRPKVWYLSPGDGMSYHRQDQQEEFYYVLQGPGRMKIAGELRDVPEGSAVRVPPETPRQILNDTDEGEHIWLIIGAPNVEDDGLPPEPED